MKSKKIINAVIISVLCLLCCVLASITFGARSVSVDEIINAIFRNSTETIGEIAVLERIPRTVFGLLAGAALGVSGALMQAITRNPIADPSILGVNTGASLFVVGGIAFWGISTPGEYMALALIGATVTAIFVYGIGSMGQGGATPIKLALAGSAASAALSSLISAIVIPRSSVMDAYRFWQVGSVSGAEWEGILTITPFLVAGIVIGLCLSSALDAMALGEEAASGLGVNTGLIRLFGAAAGVMLCGATTALAGPIGFVGLMVPHIMRIIFGSNQKILIPFSAVGGAVLLTVADVIGRLIGSPGELEAGVVTAIIGAPILIFIAMRSKGGINYE